MNTSLAYKESSFLKVIDQNRGIVNEPARASLRRRVQSSTRMISKSVLDLRRNGANRKEKEGVSCETLHVQGKRRKHAIYIIYMIRAVSDKETQSAGSFDWRQRRAGANGKSTSKAASAARTTTKPERAALSVVTGTVFVFQAEQIVAGYTEVFADADERVYIGFGLARFPSLYTRLRNAKNLRRTSLAQVVFYTQLFKTFGKVIHDFIIRKSFAQVDLNR